MAEDKIRLEIVTPEKQVFHQMVEWFYVPTDCGPTAVLDRHALMVTALIPGILRYRRAGREEMIVVGEGFLEVRDNEAEILTNNAELTDDIDVERALAARERALQRLAAPTGDLDVLRAQASLARANARLSAKGVS